MSKDRVCNFSDIYLRDLFRIPHVRIVTTICWTLLNSAASMKYAHWNNLTVGAIFSLVNNVFDPVVQLEHQKYDYIFLFYFLCLQSAHFLNIFMRVYRFIYSVLKTALVSFAFNWCNYQHDYSLHMKSNQCIEYLFILMIRYIKIFRVSYSIMPPRHVVVSELLR